MMAIYWLKSLLRTAAGPTAAAAAGIALAVALASVLGVFVFSATATMTERAIAHVPVDWQVGFHFRGNRVRRSKSSTIIFSKATRISSSSSKSTDWRRT